MKMMVLQLLMMASLTINGAIAGVAKIEIEPLKIVTRAEWNAREPKEIVDMTNPVPYVIIHHSYIPGPCNNSTECEEAMRKMQHMHMDLREWFDIGYSFAVGGDGKIYEGRGWSREGAHAPKYNRKSIGICTIGDFRSELPPAQQLNGVKKLIEMGVKSGKISKDYKLIGHRQVRPTECPGQAYFDEIQNWPHYSKEPKVVKIKDKSGN